jgi:ABC-2 type transport system ATP-binding protein
MNEIIKCTNLSKRFKRRFAVDELDLSINQGEIFGFLGPNGAGKSTTLRMMVGLIRPTSGNITIYGHNVWSDHCKALKNVGALVEAPSFYGYLSARSNLNVLANSGNNYSDKDIDSVLDRVGLLDRANDKVKTYSQGMRQRLGIALAIIGNPKLILLDEPTNGLDPQGMKEVRELIKKLRDEQEMTVFLSSHLLNEIEQICDSVAIINKGKTIQTGKVSEIISGKNVFKLDAKPIDKAIDIISKLDWVSKYRSDIDSIIVTLNENNPNELNKLLVQNDIEVYTLEPLKTTLEEQYLKLVENSNAETD